MSRRAPASLPSSSTSSCPHTHTPITSPPPTQTTSLTPNPPQTTLLPPQPSRNKQPEFHSGLRNTDSLSRLLNPQSPYSYPKKRQSNATPQIILKNSTLSLERHSRILEVTLDPQFTFGPLINNLVSRITPRLNILKALAGTHCGQQKETIVTAHKSIIRSVIIHAAPNTAHTNIKKLQTLQNTALRIATGCAKTGF